MGGKAAQAITAILALISLLLFPVQVYADPAVPSPFTVGTPGVFRHIFETDDFLLIFPYEITYASSQPSQPASQIFTYRLMDAAGTTQLASVLPYCYNNNGYGKGVISIYFSADDAPAWEGAYIIRIAGNPLYWSTLPTPASATLSTANYSTLTTAAANRTALANWIMTECTTLEIDWGVKLYDTSTSGSVTLTTTGQTYFTTVIPGLASVCPEIMAVTTATPEWTETSPPGTSAAEAWVAQWDGTTLKQELTKWGDTWHVEWNAVSGGILFIIMVFAAAFSQLKWGNGDAGFLVGEVILVVGTFAGLIYWAIVGVNMIVLGWYTAHNIFWKNG